MKKQLGIFFALGLLLTGIGYKWQMQGIDSSAVELKEVPNRLRSLDRRIKQKEKELERAGRFEEFEIAKQLNELKKLKLFFFNTLLTQLPIREAIPAQQCPLNKKFIRIVYAKSFVHKVDHQDEIIFFNFHPQENSIVYGLTDGAVYKWYVQSKKTDKEFEESSGVKIVHYSPDARKIIIGKDDDQVIIKDVRGKKKRDVLDQSASIWNMHVSPDSSLLAVGLTNGTAALWDLRSNQLIRIVPYSIDRNAIAFSPDSKSMAISAPGNTATIWDIRSGGKKEISAGAKGINALNYSADGSKLAAGTHDGIIGIWDPIAGQKLGADMQHGTYISAVAFSPDGKHIVSASDSSAKVWRVDDNQLVHTLPHYRGVNFVRYSPDGTQIITGSEDNTAQLWDAQTGKLLFTMPHNTSVRAAAFSPDGSMLVTRSQDALTSWDIDELRAVKKLLAYPNRDQCDLLQALQMATNQKKRIQATIDQWQTFTTLPKVMQKTFALYIKAPPKLNMKRRTKRIVN